MKRPFIRIGQITLDCAPHQVKAMVDFYTALLGYEVEGADGPFPYLFGKEGEVCITLQPEEGYSPLDWPDGPIGQQVHIDFAVTDLQAAVDYAVSIGAKESSKQFGKNWHILLDPAGHPFCFVDFN